MDMLYVGKGRSVRLGADDPPKNNNKAIKAINN